MSDFSGMSGALIVCLIAQSIVFIALGIMAGVIYLAGRLAGGNDRPIVHPLSGPESGVPAAYEEPSEEQGELAAVVMGALSAELGIGPEADAVAQPARLNGVQGSSWRIVSLQESARNGRLK